MVVKLQARSFIKIYWRNSQTWPELSHEFKILNILLFSSIKELILKISALIVLLTSFERWLYLCKENYIVPFVSILFNTSPNAFQSDVFFTIDICVVQLPQLVILTIEVSALCRRIFKQTFVVGYHNLRNFHDLNIGKCRG